MLFQDEPLTHCLAKHLPPRALDLAEAVLIFKKTGHLPEAGGIWDQQAAFVQSARTLGWVEHRPEVQTNG